jgi:uncharacterized protein YecT (DUF1311 family)
MKSGCVSDSTRAAGRRLAEDYQTLISSTAKNPKTNCRSPQTTIVPRGADEAKKLAGTFPPVQFTSRLSRKTSGT